MNILSREKNVSPKWVLMSNLISEEKRQKYGNKKKCFMIKKNRISSQPHRIIFNVFF